MSRLRLAFFRYRGADYWVVARTLELPAASRLTPAEQSVAALLARGDSLRQIGIARGVAERTVANQVRAIYRKFGVHSREELALRLSSSEPSSAGVNE
jgi:non-specific serine/threonine protein kinase